MGGQTLEAVAHEFWELKKDKNEQALVYVPHTSLLGRTLVYLFFLSVPGGMLSMEIISVGSFYTKTISIARVLSRYYSEFSLDVAWLTNSGSQLSHCHWPTQYLKKTHTMSRVLFTFH